MSITRSLDSLVQQHDQRRQARADQAQDEASTAREAEERGNGAVLPERHWRMRAAPRPTVELAAAHEERSASSVCNRICKMYKLSHNTHRRYSPPQGNAATRTLAITSNCLDFTFFHPISMSTRISRPCEIRLNLRPLRFHLNVAAWWSQTTLRSQIGQNLRVFLILFSTFVNTIIHFCSRLRIFISSCRALNETNSSS